MLLNRFSVTFLAFTLGVSATGFAGQGLIHYIGDNRGCSAAYAGDGQGSSWDRPQSRFAEYQGGANMTTVTGPITWDATSLQHSSMDVSSMQFTGNATGSVTAIGRPQTLTSTGTSTFDVTFSLEVAVSFDLSGLVAETGHANSRGIVTLTRLGNGGGVVEQIESVSGPLAFHRTGTLQPGQYRLYAQARGVGLIPPGILSTGSGECSLNFQVVEQASCDADWNGDGMVDTRDLFLFLGDFQSSDADFNHSGITDSDDFFDFIAQYMNGC